MAEPQIDNPGPTYADGSPSAPIATPHDDRDLLIDAERANAGHPLAWGLVGGALLVIAVLLLVVQNAETTDLEWLFFSVDAPLWVLTLVAFALGGLAWAVLQAGIRRARQRSTVRRSAVRQLRRRGAPSGS